MDNICEHCSPFPEAKTEYEEWAENGCKKAAEILLNMECTENEK